MASCEQAATLLVAAFARMRGAAARILANAATTALSARGSARPLGGSTWTAHRSPYGVLARRTGCRASRQRERGRFEGKFVMPSLISCSYPPAGWLRGLLRPSRAPSPRMAMRSPSSPPTPSTWRPFGRRGRCLPADVTHEEGVEVRRYPLWHLPGQRWLLKGAAYLPQRTWRLLCMGHNPVVPSMWQAAGSRVTAFDVVHATAFPYGWPLVCGLRLARRLGVPYVLTPFVHTGDPDDRRTTASAGPTRSRPSCPCAGPDGAGACANRGGARRTASGGGGRPQAGGPGDGRRSESCTGGERERTRRRWGVGSSEVWSATWRTTVGRRGPSTCCRPQRGPGPADPLPPGSGRAGNAELSPLLAVLC